MTVAPLLANPSAIHATDILAQSLPGVVTTTRQGSAPNLAVQDPGTAEVIARVPDAEEAGFVAAVDIASEAFQSWSESTPRRRSDVLRAIYDLMMERAEDFALLISREMGKPLTDARAEVQYASDFVRWYSEEAQRPGGAYQVSPYGDSRLTVTRAPVGVCLLITPWNFPLAMATRKIAPAIAAGCSVILKPAALTPLTALLFQQVVVEAGLPEGVVTTVTTKKAGLLSRVVMADGRVRKVSFTGSTDVGKTILEQTATHVMRASLELGGNAPFVVLDDADLERAVAGAMKAKLRNGGQSCIAANRFLVQQGIADDFAKEFSRAMAAVKVGHGLAPQSELGPVIDGGAEARIRELVSRAADQGAEVVLHTEPAPGPGSWVYPTVLDRVAHDSEIAEEEVFGPVATITRFASLEEGISMANSTPFGLASYVYTQDVDRASHVAERMQSGMVGINQPVVSNVAVPFGGIGLSGLGREGGAEGLDEYQDIRLYNMSAVVPAS